MSTLEYAQIARRLLTGGVALRHASRLSREYLEHVADVVRETGGDIAEAKKRVGSCDQFVAAALARPELKSWAARWPALVYGLGVPLAYPLAVFAVVLLLVGAGRLWQASPWFAPLPVETELAVFNVVFGIIVYGTPIVVALVFGWRAVAGQHRSQWQVVGLILLCLLGSAADYGLSANGPDGSRIEVRLGWSEKAEFQFAAFAVRFFMALTLVGALSAWVWRKTSSPPKT